MNSDRSFQRLKPRAIRNLREHVVFVRIGSSNALSRPASSHRTLLLEPRVGIGHWVMTKYLEELRVRDTVVPAHEVVDDKLRSLVIF